MFSTNPRIFFTIFLMFFSNKVDFFYWEIEIKTVASFTQKDTLRLLLKKTRQFSWKKFVDSEFVKICHDQVVWILPQFFIMHQLSTAWIFRELKFFHLIFGWAEPPIMSKALPLLETCFDLIPSPSMKIQIMGGRITENLGFEPQIFSNFQVHYLNYHGRWGWRDQI